jgi:molybdopterin-guanine dinucleotide biosynthesis protein A
MLDAVVLAGSSNDGLLKECSPVEYEALIPVGSRTMVEYVIEALLGTRRIRRVLVVGPADRFTTLPVGERVSIVDSAGGIMENIEAGLKQLPGEKRVLLATSDIPLLTPWSVDNFLNLCGDMSGDLYYPIIEKNLVEKIFPNTGRTYVRLREGVFTGGNLFLINPVVYKRCLENGRKIIDLRKSPVGLCRILGVTFLVKYICRMLTLADAKNKVSQLLDINGVVVRSAFPEVGVDVDKPADLQLVLKVLSNQRPQ